MNSQQSDHSKLAHDIRNRLAVIKTDAEIALMDKETPREEFIKTLKRILLEVNVIDARLNK